MMGQWGRGVGLNAHPRLCRGCMGEGAAEIEGRQAGEQHELRCRPASLTPREMWRMRREAGRVGGGGAGGASSGLRAEGCRGCAGTVCPELGASTRSLGGPAGRLCPELAGERMAYLTCPLHLE